MDGLPRVSGSTDTSCACASICGAGCTLASPDAGSPPGAVIARLPCATLPPDWDVGASAEMGSPGRRWDRSIIGSASVGVPVRVRVAVTGPGAGVSAAVRPAREALVLAGLQGARGRGVGVLARAGRRGDVGDGGVGGGPGRALAAGRAGPGRDVDAGEGLGDGVLAVVGGHYCALSPPCRARFALALLAFSWPGG